MGVVVCVRALCVGGGEHLEVSPGVVPAGLVKGSPAQGAGRAASLKCKHLLTVLPTQALGQGKPPG